MEGDLTPSVIVKMMFSQGEGEQSVKFGDLWPYPDHPPLCWRLVNDFPFEVTVILMGVVDAPPQ
jgi:hypothetical protein